MKKQVLQKKDDNLMDYIPRHNHLYPYALNKKGYIEITVEHKGPANRIAQVLFKRSRTSQVALDELGSYIWQQIDGKRSVLEIAALVDTQFGEKAAPLYERLAQFIQMLRRAEYIVYVNKIKK